MKSARGPPSDMGEDWGGLCNSQGARMFRLNIAHSAQIQSKKYLMELNLKLPSVPGVRATAPAGTGECSGLE